MELSDFTEQLLVAAGISTNSSSERKLHVTLMNSKYRRNNGNQDKKSSSSSSSNINNNSNSKNNDNDNDDDGGEEGGNGRRSSERQSFNATKILLTFGDTFIGSPSLRQIELSSLRGVQKDSGYYLCEHKIPFPTK